MIVNGIDIPNQWPAVAFLRPTEVQKCDPGDQDTLSKLGDVNNYKMRRRVRGRALLIMNTKFPRLIHEDGNVASEYNRKRMGTVNDAVRLKSLFRQLGFRVVTRQDKTAKEMEEILDNERHHSYHDLADCFVCVVSTYGTPRSSFGIDGKKLTFRAMIEKFDDFHCPALKGKPKLFFLQSDSGTKYMYNFAQTAVSKDSAQESLGFIPWLDLPPDTLLALPNVPGYHSFLTPVGSVFLQSVVAVFEIGAYRLDISALLETVKELSMRMKVKNLFTWFAPIQGTVHMPTYFSTLGKRLYFFPGIHSEDQHTEDHAQKLPQEILDMDADDIDRYLRILRTGKVKTFNIRLMMVGLYAAGKTSLARRLMGQDPGDVQSTDGIHVHKSVCKMSINGESWTTNSENADEEPLKKLQRLSRGRSSELRLDNQDSNSDAEVEQKEEPICLQQFRGFAVFSSFWTNLLDHIAVNTPFVAVLAVWVAMAIYFGLIPTRLPTSLMECLELFFRAIPFFLIVYLLYLLWFKEPGYCLKAQGLLEEDLEADNDPVVRELNIDQLENIRKVADSRAAEESSDDKSQATVSIWDFAGQFVYYSTHQLFFTPRAIYILVMKMTNVAKDLISDDVWFLDAKGVEQLPVEGGWRFWMKNVFTYGRRSDGKPNVIFVGTHRDQIPGTLEEQNKFSEKYFDSVRECFVDKDMHTMVDENTFFVNNKIDNVETEELKKTIVRIAKGQKHWGEEIPAKWIQLESSLIDLRSTGKPVVSLSDVIEADRQSPSPIEDTTEIKLFLHFHHNAGLFVYYDEENLNESVVLEPQWIIDAFSFLITADRFKSKFGALKLEWKQMNETALMDKNLAERIWAQASNKLYSSHSELLLQLMERLNIIASITVEDETNGNLSMSKIENFESVREGSTPVLKHKYFVPCLLKDSPPEELLLPVKLPGCTAVSSTLCFQIEKSFLLPAIVHRLMSACIGQWSIAKQGKKHLLYCGCGVFEVKGSPDDRHRIVVFVIDDAIAVRVSRHACSSKQTSNLDWKICDGVRRFIEVKLDHEFKRIRASDFAPNTKSYSVKVACPEHKHLDMTEDLLDVDQVVEDAEKTEEMLCDSHSDKLHLHSVNARDLLWYWYPEKVKPPKYLAKNTDAFRKWMDDLEDDIKGRIPDDKTLAKMAGALGSDWETIGFELGLTDIDVDQCKEDHPGKSFLQKFKMMKCWKNRNGTAATMKELLQAFNNCPTKRIDVDLIKNVVELIV